MSLVVSSPIQIHNSPLNTSPSKQLYSFPKSPRFHQRSQSQIDIIYDLPNTKSSRAAGIGYGQKYNMVNFFVVSPPPTTYTLKSDIEISKEKRLGWTLGLGRETSPQFGIFSQTISHNSLPGPGNYKIPSSLSKIKYSMRPKTTIRTPQEIQNVPGPGTYEEIPSLNVKARYPITKYKRLDQQKKQFQLISYGTTTFNPARSLRFKDNKSHYVPGPGTYKSVGISPEGRYFNSKHGSSKVRSFGHARRITFGNKLDYPGPGDYRLPSDFGHYESAKEHRKKNKK